MWDFDCSDLEKDGKDEKDEKQNITRHIASIHAGINVSTGSVYSLEMQTTCIGKQQTAPSKHSEREHCQ